MKSRAWSRFLTVLVTVFALAYVLPTFVGAENLPKWYTALFPKTLNYGLDLQGGLELRYTVDYKLAIRDNSNRTRDSLVTRLAEAKAGKLGVDATPEKIAELRGGIASELLDYNRFKIVFTSPDDADLVDDDAVIGAWQDKYEIDGRSGGEVTFAMTDAKVFEVRDNVVKETLVTFRNRIDAFGLVEPDVRRNGETEIDVQLPGVDKEHMEVVRERLGQTAQLTFRLVDHTDYFADKAPTLNAYKAANPAKAASLEIRRDPTFGHTTLTGRTKAELVAFAKTLTFPDNRQLGYEFVEERKEGRVTDSYWKTHLVEATPALTGETLSRALVLNDPQEGWYVLLELNSEGADIFGDLTEAHVGDEFAIMLDDDVSSAPRIQEPIRGGRARITMGGNRSPNEVLSEARSLVTVLNHGAYKAPVHKIHDHEVGPSLGADSIKSGKISLTVGALLVIVFMTLYYRTGGLIANLALLLNVIFIVATLVNFNAAMTLPGMAGLILTIGMAVDANVLIFERIREELRSGKSAKAAVEAGYDRAFWTIFDANITTALTGLILLNYTSGPIYGFAVVLLTGIVFSVLTAFFVTRMVFDVLFDKKKLKTLAI